MSDPDGLLTATLETGITVLSVPHRAIGTSGWLLNLIPSEGLFESGLAGKRARAEDLLRQLDLETLDRLAELLAAGKGKGHPAN